MLAPGKSIKHAWTGSPSNTATSSGTSIGMQTPPFLPSLSLSLSLPLCVCVLALFTSGGGGERKKKKKKLTLLT